ACLSMLAIDACVSPRGELVVTCHSGAPDWGTGPSGKGKLYKISYTDKSTAQPALAYAASPGEFRIAFDRPLDAAQLKNLARQTAIARGKYVTAGDRFESFRPGYQVVSDQLAAPRSKVPVLSASVTPDGRVLVLKTPPQHDAANYSITLPRLSGRIAANATELPQHPQNDVATDLAGVEAQWRAETSSKTWTGWLPHLDLTVARAFTTNSAEQEQLWPLLRTAGTLEMRTQLDLSQMLRPAVQPGSKIDYSLPAENVTLVFTASAPFSAKTSATNLTSSVAPDGRHELAISQVPKEGEWVPLEISLRTISRPEPSLELAWHTAEDSRPRALPLRRLLLPWARSQPESISQPSERQIPELAGGNWLRGRKIFSGDTVACHKCHQLGGIGGKAGPDLSNLIYRDYESVRKDILYP